MKSRLNKSLTLIELLIAISIFTLIVAGFSNIDTFSRYHVITSDKKVKLQNDASYVLEHMAKEIAKAIGDVANVPVVIDDSNRRIKIYIDLAMDGQSPGDGQRGTGGDRWRAYRYRDSSAPAVERYQIWYCPQCTDSTCDTCNPAWGTVDNNTLSKKINSFTPTYDNIETDGDPRDDYIEIQITACWDPSVAYGTLDNPALSMKNRISMPAVSTH